MNYELAKQLFDSGFKNEGNDAERENHRIQDGSLHGTNFGVPTLSELIEACGERFMQLSKVYGVRISDHVSVPQWLAIAVHLKEYVIGDTPEEAVARLWLAINSKRSE